MAGRIASGCIASAVIALVGVVATAQESAGDGQWRAYSGDTPRRNTPRSTKSTRATSASCASSWRRPALDASIRQAAPQLRAARNFRATPLMIDGVLFGTNGVGFVEAFDPGTGKTIWVEPPLEQGPSGYRGASTRGLAYWTDGDGRANSRPAQRIPDRVERDDRQAVRGFRQRRPRLPVRRNGAGHALHVDRRAARGRRRCRSRHVAARRRSRTKEATRTDVRAYDVRTGKLRWTFHVIPQAGRARRRDVGERFLAVHGPCAGLVAVQRRRGARVRLHADHRTDQRHVRRPPAR